MTADQEDPRIEAFRDQLRTSLKAGGVSHEDKITANIEGLIVAHLLRLIDRIG